MKKMGAAGQLYAYDVCLKRLKKMVFVIVEIKLNNKVTLFALLHIYLTKLRA